MSANTIQSIFHITPSTERPGVTVEPAAVPCFQGLHEVTTCAETLTVWEKRPGNSPCSWQQLDYAEWGDPSRVAGDRKYYSHQTEHPLFAWFRDFFDALKIGLSTLWDKIKRFLWGKDTFFLSEQIREQARDHIRNTLQHGMRPCATNRQSERGGFIKRGHAHLGFALPTQDHQPLYIAIDPAVNQLGPGYTPQLTPVIPEGLENTDLVLITHAHLDHFIDTMMYQPYPAPPSLMQRMIKAFRQFICFLSGLSDYDTAPSVPLKTRLCFPAGSENIDPIFQRSLEHQCVDGNPVGLPAHAFIPYTIRRTGCDDIIATLVTIPSKHWAGTNPLTNFHKAPGFGYLLMTENDCIFDAGDTGYSAEMYDAVAAIAATNPHPDGPTYVTALFSPAGPDFERKHMEKTHQATIDTARCITKLQLIPFIREQLNNGITDKQEILRRFMAETECHFIHWGHYKLGPIHFEDPWICWLQLLFNLRGYNFDLQTIGEGATDIQGLINSPEYRATLEAVTTQIQQDLSEVNAECETQHLEQWDQSDIANILMKTLFTQVATNHETSFGHQQHSDTADWICDSTHNIRLENLTLHNLSRWFFTHPDDRSETLFHEIFRCTGSHQNVREASVSTITPPPNQPTPAPDLSISVY